MIEGYKRWRHSRGYGVHSPYAFRLVTDVFRSKRGYAYYGYHELENKLHEYVPPQLRKQLRRLFRLAAVCDIGSAFLPDTENLKHFTNALRCANSKIGLTSELILAENARFIATVGSLIPLESLQRYLERPGRIIAIKDVPKHWKESLFESLDEGLMFYGKRNLIIFNRPGMQKVAYSISI